MAAACPHCYLRLPICKYYMLRLSLCMRVCVCVCVCACVCLPSYIIQGLSIVVQFFLQLMHIICHYHLILQSIPVCMRSLLALLPSLSLPPHLDQCYHPICHPTHHHHHHHHLHHHHYLHRTLQYYNWMRVWIGMAKYWIIPRVGDKELLCVGH